MSNKSTVCACSAQGSNISSEYPYSNKSFHPCLTPTNPFVSDCIDVKFV